MCGVGEKFGKFVFSFCCYCGDGGGGGGSGGASKWSEH